MLLLLLAGIGVLVMLAIGLFVVGTFRLLATVSPFATTAPAAVASPLTLPSGVVWAIGAALGVLAGFVHTFGFAAPWATVLSIGIVFFGAIGISPLVGTAFRNALHLPAAAAVVITAGLTALTAAAPTFHAGSTWLGVIQGIIAFAATLGFGPLPVAPAKKYGLV